ncbi:hypothetical protein, partial [Pseudomonas aeruginosa]|uniref:hypothetical protein n=1 Tax=Pseudomonas aeruginosa TaxID=287 RepID=UPI00301E29B0
CFIGKLGGWGRGILPNQKVFFRVSLAQILFLCLTKSMRRFLGGSFSWTGSFEPEAMNVFLPAFQSLVGGGIERSH